MNNLCYNCGRDAQHLAMYCDNKPQKIRRCDDCWAAATRDSEHLFSCYRRVCYSEISPTGSAHRIQPRIAIRTSGHGIRLVENAETVVPSIGPMYRSRIAEHISFQWANVRGVSVFGPRTMYFRVPIIVGDKVAIRADVLFDIVKINVINQNVNRLSAVLNAAQTVCALSLPRMSQKVDILAVHSIFFVKSKISDEIIVQKIEHSAVDVDAIGNFANNAIEDTPDN